MFVPSDYRADSAAQLWSVITGHPLGLLVTVGPDVPFATHLPVVPAGDSDSDGDLVGAVLLGHLNRANPQWGSLVDGQAAKLIFVGPHAYVTPAVYPAAPAAPTWNFVAVHVTGVVRPVTTAEETLAVVRRTALLLEHRFGDGWDQDGSANYFRSIVAGVGAFRFEVTTADGTFKLSQDKPAHVRRRIADRLAEPDQPGGPAVAALMNGPR
ncbi:negative transcriptional regulator, PaiB family [Micromonospora pattaloongensis]|uniref:Negative transcriptional regulator, PaiB family n=1 Tax=Micromonospora pattaloongensis TaxID=405436 RepID=A0A1H3JVB0_9ACTN|nr:FMN-binding negative transcriptional regulator [Micromonospora pattaloongensis]SDY43897.1 negative transcriptional regulator, PaiB family [Micromonospora pattaloongensis]